MATKQSWKLKRYGRLFPGPGEKESPSWKVYETLHSKPEIVVTIVEAGYLLIMQGNECLDTIPLQCGSDILKVHQKSDNLMFRFTMKGEGRMVRMQFDGSSQAEAIKECSTVMEKLKEYIPINQEDAPLPPNQPPAEASAPVTELNKQRMVSQAMETGPEVVQGSLSIKQLTQHFLGETAVTLPQVYHRSNLAQGDLEPILRICLLDPSFPSFVEKVEVELKKLLED